MAQRNKKYGIYKYYRYKNLETGIKKQKKPTEKSIGSYLIISECLSD